MILLRVLGPSSHMYLIFQFTFYIFFPNGFIRKVNTRSIFIFGSSLDILSALDQKMEILLVFTFLMFFVYCNIFLILIFGYVTPTWIDLGINNNTNYLWKILPHQTYFVNIKTWGVRLRFVVLFSNQCNVLSAGWIFLPQGFLPTLHWYIMDIYHSIIGHYYARCFLLSTNLQGNNI